MIETALTHARTAAVVIVEKEQSEREREPNLAHHRSEDEDGIKAKAGCCGWCQILLKGGEREKGRDASIDAKRSLRKRMGSFVPFRSSLRMHHLQYYILYRSSLNVQ
jgi:hypothetical protein